LRYGLEITDGVDLMTGSSPLPEGAIVPVSNWDEMIVLPWYFRKVVAGEVREKTEEEKEAYLEANPPTMEELQEEAQQYLNDTDWYIIRANDPSSGVAVPQDIIDSRADAREIL